MGECQFTFGGCQFAFWRLKTSREGKGGPPNGGELLRVPASRAAILSQIAVEWVTKEMNDRLFRFPFSVFLSSHDGERKLQFTEKLGIPLQPRLHRPSSKLPDGARQYNSPQQTKIARAILWKFLLLLFWCLEPECLYIYIYMNGRLIFIQCQCWGEIALSV